MSQSNGPVSANIFNAAGVLAWVVAGVAFFREETMSMVIPRNGLPVDIDSIQLLHDQMGELLLWCTFALVGTLFFGFAAILSQNARRGSESITTTV